MEPAREVEQIPFNVLHELDAHAFLSPVLLAAVSKHMLMMLVDPFTASYTYRLPGGSLRRCGLFLDIFIHMAKCIYLFIYQSDHQQECPTYR